MIRKEKTTLNKKSKKMTSSVVVCTKNRLDDLQKFVASLSRQRQLPTELVIVDSSDGPIIQDYLLSLSVSFQTRYYRAPLGLTRARNVGIRNSRGDLLFFFDDDVDLEENYLARVGQVFVLDAQGEIGAVGGRIINNFPEKNVALLSRLNLAFFDLLKTVFLLSKLGNGKFRYSGMPSQPHALSASGYIECLSGGCMAFRREVFDFAQFDEGLIGYGHVEDVDISKQVLDAGYKIYYEAAAELRHYPSEQDRGSFYNLAKFTVINYAHYFRARWPQTGLRKAAFWWAIIGLCLIYGRKGIMGAFSGIQELYNVSKSKQSSL